jgi:hypothetical protein
MIRTIILALLWGLVLLGLMYGAIATVETHPFYQDVTDQWRR